MREYSLTIDKAFQQGLRVDQRSQRGEDFLSRCTGCKPSQFGLVPEDTITNPFSTTQYSVFPFKQLLRGNAVTILADSTSLQLANELVTPWDIEDVRLFDAYDTNDEGSIGFGGVWHLVDFWNVWLLFNGVTSVFKTHLLGMYGSEDYVFTTDKVKINTGCAFRGRALFGGFDPLNYVTADWQSFWEHWIEGNSVRFPNAMQLGKNFVSWTTIGGGDLLNVFYPNNAVLGTISADTSRGVDDSVLFDLYKRNELGFMPMPSQGEVMCIKPLGDGVMVYSSDSVVYLFPVVDPVPTFGMKKIAGFGIAGRGAVGGTDMSHVCVDTSGCAWSIAPNLAITRLGYNEFLNKILFGEMVVSFDENRNEYYVSGVTKDGQVETYVLGSQGLSQSREAINSCLYNRGELLGIKDVTKSNEAQVSTNMIDFGIPDLKTIGMLEVMGQGLSNVSVSVDYRYDSNATFVQSPWVHLNKMGFAYVGKTAKEFRVNLMSTKPETLTVQQVAVKWKLSGKRSIRGIYAAPNTSRPRSEALG
jgi:hypothetical protein